MKMTVSPVPTPKLAPTITWAHQPHQWLLQRKLAPLASQTTDHVSADKPVTLPSNYDTTRWPVLSKVWFLPTTTGNSSPVQQMWNSPQTSPSAPTYHVLPSTHINLRKSCMFVLLNVVGVTIESMDTERARHGSPKTPATTVTPDSC
jgi:hypothetical protein